ncbi:hypothetical protein B0F90DRAFT_1670584 [Multifurca ochricompacta]|uniref:Uncharacterized protein n=1 Tax=Multifurca ochricompacta TaxID=376703 RepID=A0AAD4QH13_9AGAM|nr:hypothetical protein B0F90DRAFT_1670584 [Multifurca ochricompacta]
MPEKKKLGKDAGNTSKLGASEIKLVVISGPSGVTHKGNLTKGVCVNHEKGSIFRSSVGLYDPSLCEKEREREGRERKKAEKDQDAGVLAYIPKKKIGRLSVAACKLCMYGRIEKPLQKGDSTTQLATMGTKALSHPHDKHGRPERAVLSESLMGVDGDIGMGRLGGGGFPPSSRSRDMWRLEKTNKRDSSMLEKKVRTR